MNQSERLPFFWRENIPMTAAEIADLVDSHRSTVYRKLAGLKPARINPRRWFPRDVERIIFHGEEVANG